MALNIKNSIVKYVCVIMLLLIQFDAYGYQIMEAFCECTTEQMETLPTDEQTLDENCLVSEWTDPIYNMVKSCVRSLIRLFSFISVDIFSFIQPYPILRGYYDHHHLQSHILPQRQHVVYCTYQI